MMRSQTISQVWRTVEVRLKYTYGKPYNIDTNGSDFAELILTPKG